MPKVHKTFRMGPESVELLEAYARDAGISNSEAMERLIRAGTAQDGPKDAAPTDGADSGTTERLQAVVDVLRESNSDLRQTVSTLTMQLSVKDEQIAAINAQIAQAHDLANQAQQLHAIDKQRALPEHRPSLWERMRGRGRVERDNG